MAVRGAGRVARCVRLSSASDAAGPDTRTTATAARLPTAVSGAKMVLAADSESRADAAVKRRRLGGPVLLPTSLFQILLGTALLLQGSHTCLLLVLVAAGVVVAVALV